MRDWGRWVGQRYGGVDALVWVIGGDYLPPAEGLALVSEVQAGIAEFDTRHVFTAHWAGDVSALEADVSWVELNNTYTYAPTYTLCREDYELRERPFVLIESVYENEYGSTTQQVRAQAYYAWLSGAKGQFFGNNPVWKFQGDWKKALNSRGVAGMMHLRSFFASIEWTSLEPDVDDEFILSGRGRWGERDFAVLARDPGRTLAVAYIPSPRVIQLDLRSMAGPCEARWFDPTDGSFHPVSGSPLPNEQGVEVPAQETNGDGDGDWILLLQVEE
jgi:hypothetical protein